MIARVHIPAPLQRKDERARIKTTGHGEKETEATTAS